MTQVVVQGYRAYPEPSCCDIYCCRETPVLMSCQKCCGCLYMCFGTGLNASVWCCCYGCSRPSCCSACCAAAALTFSSVFIYGIIASIIIGFKMMCI